MTISVPLSGAPTSSMPATQLIREIESYVLNPVPDVSLLPGYCERARNVFIAVLGEAGPFEERLATWLRSGGCRRGFAYIFMPVPTNDVQRVFATILRSLIVAHEDQEAQFRRAWIAEQLRQTTWYRSIIVETKDGPYQDWEPVPTPSLEKIVEMIDGEIRKANKMMQIREVRSIATSMLEALRATVVATSTVTMTVNADAAVLQGDQISLAAAEHRFLSAIASSPDLSVSESELQLAHVPPMVTRLRRKFEEKGWKLHLLSSNHVYQLRSIERMPA